MNHKSIIKAAIAVVIVVAVVWSIINIATYAYNFHATRWVAFLCVVVGGSLALSVYARMVTHDEKTVVWSTTGIVLFGLASCVLQTLLYLHDNAPIVAALTFGCIGPVAEGVLSALHAALSEEKDSVPPVQPQQNEQQTDSNAAPAPQPKPIVANNEAAEELRQRALDAINNGSANGPTTVGNVVGTDKANASRLLKRLADDGLIERLGGGKYGPINNVVQPLPVAPPVHTNGHSKEAL